MDTRYYACRYADGSVSFFHAKGKSRQLVLNSMHKNALCYQLRVCYQKNFTELKVSTISRYMLLNHYIKWVYCESEKCGQCIVLDPGERPNVTFSIPKGDKVKAIYVLCSIHGLRRIEAVDFEIGGVETPSDALPNIKDPGLADHGKGD